MAAIDQTRGLAKCNCIPWHIPVDQQYFKSETQKYGGKILMGSKTYPGHPLEGRQNFVASRRKEELPGATVVNDIDGFIKSLDGDLWVIGGQDVFEATIDQADELYLTLVEATFGCDRFFPEYETDFKLVKDGHPQHQNGFTFRYTVWRRHLPEQGQWSIIRELRASSSAG